MSGIINLRVGATHPPRVWLLMGQKLGDNTQVQTLADGLGWPYESKRFFYRKTELITNRTLGPTLAGIVKSESSVLAPPWPELVISAGRRNEPVARWIRKQSPRHVRLVHLGRPWARLDCFDLIITTPQYQLPARPNILHNTVPLFGVTAAKLAQAAAAWKPRLAHLPRPRLGVLVGGNSGAFTLDVDTAQALARAANSMAETQGAALLVTTSARTPPAAADALEARITVPKYFYRWSAQAAENPYFGYLALAERFIVTADSVSMLIEACATQKPVYIFDPEEAAWLAGRRQGRRLRFRTLVQHLSVRIGPRRMRRDVGAIQRRLIEEGRAAWLGEPFPEGRRPPPLRDLERAVGRVRALFE